MRARLASAAALGAAVLLSLPAHAATTVKPQITDPKGDANGVNGQGFLLGGPSVSSPAQEAAADITSVTLATTSKIVQTRKVVTGFTVKMALSAAPSTSFVYRLNAKTADCSDLFIAYEAGATDIYCPPSGANPAAADTHYKVPKAKVSGSTITWTIPTSAFRVGSAFSNLDATTRQVAAVVTAPQWDDAFSSTASFTVGK